MRICILVINRYGPFNNSIYNTCAIDCVIASNDSSFINPVCNCIPIGNPSDDIPAGKLIAGTPAIFEETVK